MKRVIIRCGVGASNASRKHRRIAANSVSTKFRNSQVSNLDEAIAQFNLMLDNGSHTLQLLPLTRDPDSREIESYIVQLRDHTANTTYTIQDVQPYDSVQSILDKLCQYISSSKSIDSSTILSCEDYYEDALSVDGFYDMFVPYLDTSTMEKAAQILYNWYTEEGEEYMPDRSDVLDMCDAATDERDKQLVLYALGEISEDELD